MSDNPVVALDQVFRQVTDPWDWVLGIMGALGGILASMKLGDDDLGRAAATGFLIGVAVRKAIMASAIHLSLRRSAAGLAHQIQIHDQKIPGFKNLLDELREEEALWKKKVIDNQDFEEGLSALIKKYRDQTARIRESRGLGDDVF